MAYRWTFEKDPLNLEKLSERSTIKYDIIEYGVRGDTHTMSTFKGLKGKTKMRCGGLGDSKCSGRPIVIFFIKDNLICAMTRHYAESNINILLTRYFPIDSAVRQ